MPLVPLGSYGNEGSGLMHLYLLNGMFLKNVLGKVDAWFLSLSIAFVICFITIHIIFKLCKNIRHHGQKKAKTLVTIRSTFLLDV